MCGSNKNRINDIAYPNILILLFIVSLYYFFEFEKVFILCTRYIRLIYIWLHISIFLFFCCVMLQLVKCFAEFFTYSPVCAIVSYILSWKYFGQNILKHFQLLWNIHSHLLFQNTIHVNDFTISIYICKFSKT